MLLLNQASQLIRVHNRHPFQTHKVERVSQVFAPSTHTSLIFSHHHSPPAPRYVLRARLAEANSSADAEMVPGWWRGAKSMSHCATSHCRGTSNMRHEEKKRGREQIRSCSTAEKDKLSVMTAKRENVSDDKKEHEWGEVWREKAGTSCTEATACPNV